MEHKGFHTFQNGKPLRVFLRIWANAHLTLPWNVLTIQKVTAKKTANGRPPKNKIEIDVCLKIQAAVLRVSLGKKAQVGGLLVAN